MSENVTNDENKKTVGFKVSQHEYNVLKQYAASIQKSVEQQFTFVSKIGIYEIQQEIENMVKAMTRVMATRFEQDSGVETKMTPSDIDEIHKDSNKGKGKVPSTKE
jgi:hypothetical protein